MSRSPSSWPLIGAIVTALSTVGESAEFVTYNSSTTETTAFWKDLVPMFTNASNVAVASLDLTLAGMKSPNMTDSASMTGYDWTQPWPGSSIDGHGANLRVAFDISMPSDVVDDAASNIAALTFPVPDSMAGAAMDPSWFICRHFFIGTPNITAPDHTCSFLGEQCIEDLKTNLTAKWMTADNSTYCGALAFDPIPNSCIDAFGYTTMDVISFDADTLAVDGEADLLASDNVSKDTYMMGTGYGYVDSSSRREKAANRTYLIADVWGYSDSVAEADRQTPDVSIACLTPVLEAGSVLNDTTTISSFTAVATSTVSAVNTTAPAPTQTGIVDGCTEWYVAVTGDNCEAIVMDYDLTLDIFLEWNPAVGDNCTDLLAGDAYCVEIPGYSRTTGAMSTIASASATANTTPIDSATAVKSTTSTTMSTATGVATPAPVQTGMVDDCDDFYLVQSGDGCWAIANDEGITLDDFYAWNPAVGDDCSGLQADVYVCIGISGGATIDTITVSPTTTSAAAAATANVPSPTQSGIASNCDSYALAGTGDYCYAFAESNGITTDELYEWNTILGEDGADCSSDFWAGYYYCVGVSS